MREVWEDSLWCEVVLEKVEELGDPVRDDRDGFRSCNVPFASGLNERAVAILVISQGLFCRTQCHAHYSKLSYLVWGDEAEPAQSKM